MSQTTFDFDQRAIDDAVEKVHSAAKYVSGLGGFASDDPMGLAILRQHVASLRDGIGVLNELADSLQALHDRRSKSSKKKP